MSTEQPSKCCVCGEPTTKRCQACAKSGIDLFFCSPEHQKLVWKHHKQVCGPNAHPFRYPPLSHEEVDKLLALENAPLTAGEQRGLAGAIDRFPLKSPEFAAKGHECIAESSIGKMFERGLELPVGTYADTVRLFGSKAFVENRSRSSVHLLSLREFISCREAQASESAGLRLTNTPYWTIVSGFETILITHDPELLLSGAADTLPVSRYRHQVVATVSLAMTRLAKGSTVVPLDFVRNSFERLLNYLNAIQPFNDTVQVIQALQPVVALLKATGLEQLSVGRSASGRFICIVP